MHAGYGVQLDHFSRVRQWNTAGVYYSMGNYRYWTVVNDVSCASGQRYGVMNFTGERRFDGVCAPWASSRWQPFCFYT